MTEKEDGKFDFKFGFKIPSVFELGVKGECSKNQHYMSRIKRFSYTVSTCLGPLVACF